MIELRRFAEAEVLLEEAVSRFPGNIGKTPGVAALFSCAGSEEPDSSYV
jgi:hypothetical protein